MPVTFIDDYDVTLTYHTSEFTRKHLHYRGFTISANRYFVNRWNSYRLYASITCQSPEFQLPTYHYIHSDGAIHTKTINLRNEFTGYFPTIEAVKAAINKYHASQSPIPNPN